ncbi:hypothetical protein BLNAU_23497 [Blattamonas nauphoetae]|uniref:Uncharacterized protein n=1 Tax=Blattamonas nauphoetae TaxID=2049346 RepID=A0ABQ9WQ35_9EUKA|nr:hypothetical protein BLNAU_23497 [Blattamonas nauphoetae]
MHTILLRILPLMEKQFENFELVMECVLASTSDAATIDPDDADENPENEHDAIDNEPPLETLMNGRAFIAVENDTYVTVRRS